MSTFLSYSRRDHVVAERLHQALLIEHVKAWRDSSKLLPGDELSPAIMSAIASSTTFVLLWSRAAAASTWVQRELAHALALEGRDGPKPIIVPVRLDDHPVPDRIADRVHAALHPDSDGHDLEQLVRLLVRLDEPAPDVGRTGSADARSFTDHGIEVRRTAAGAFWMQLDVVSVDLEENGTILSQFEFSGSVPRAEGFDDRAQIDRILVALASEFRRDPYHLSLRSSDVKRARMSLVDIDDTLTVTFRARRLGGAGRGTLLFPVGSLFDFICETYGLAVPEDPPADG